MSNHDPEDAVQEILRRMYREATPSIGLKTLRETGIGKMTNFYKRFYLEQPKQESIIKAVLHEYNFTGDQRDAIETEVRLGSSPTSNYKQWKQAWKHDTKEGLK